MNKSTKNFGYGFSALALALSSVNLPAILGTASASAADCPTGSETVDATCVYTVKTAAAFKEVASSAAIDEKTTVIKLGADIDTTTVENGAVFATAKTIDLNGKTLTGGLTIKKGANVIVKDSSAKKTGKIVANGAVVTVNIEQGGNAAIELMAGNYSGTTLVSRSGDTLGGERVTISGGDYTKVAALTDGTDYARSILLAGNVSAGVFAASPIDYVDNAAQNVVSDGTHYAVAAKTTLNTTISADGTYNNGGDEEEALLGTLTYSNTPVEDTYKISSALSYTVTTEDEDGEAVEVDFDNLFVLGDATVNKDTKTTTIPVSVKEGAPAGAYKLTVKTSDIAKEAANVSSEEFDVTIVDAAEQLIGDFFIAKGAEDQAVVIDTDAVAEFIEAQGFTGVTYTSSNAGKVAVDANGQVTVKAGAEGVYTITANFDDATSFSYKVNVLDTTAVVTIADVTDEDAIVETDLGTFTGWADATISDKGETTFEDKYDGEHTWDQEYTNTVFTPSSNVGTSTRTYTHSGAIATLNTETNKIEVKKNSKIEKTVKVYTVKLSKSEVALKYDATKPETLDLTTLALAPSDVAVAVALDEAGDPAATAKVDDESPASNVKAAHAKATDTFEVTFSATGAANVVAPLTVSTYAESEDPMVAEADAIQYVEIGNSVTSTTALNQIGSGSEFETSTDEATVNDANKVVYNGTKNGSEKVTISEVLGGQTINTGTIEYRTVGLDLETDRYVKPGEALTLTAEELTENYGSVKVSTTDALATKNSDGSYTFTSSAKAGETYTITLSDTLDKDVRAKIGHDLADKTITVHVDDYFITSTEDSFVIESGETSDSFKVETSDKKLPDYEIVDSQDQAAAGITLEQVSFASGVTTYKIKTTAAMPGNYTVKFALKDNPVETVEVKVKVTQHVTMLPDGIYTIASIIDENAVIDIPGQSKNDGASAQVYKANGTRAQQFSFTKDEDGFYTIRNLASGKVLEATATINNGDVQQNSINGKDNQKWAILLNVDPVEDGDPIISFTLASKADENYVIDLPGRGTKNGTNVQVYKANDTVAQKFTIARDESFDEDKIGNALDGKTYKIRSTKNTDMVLDVAGRSKENGGNVQAYEGYDPEDGVNVAQAFTFEWVNDNNEGFYVIHTNTDEGTDRVLDVANGGTASGSNVWQYKYNGTLAQKWIVKEVGDGKYSFQSALSGLYLDLANNPFTVNNGSNLQTYTGNGTTAQIFTLDEVDE
ncbi:RICIN domain-containing protein [Candidatus Saccharibacteria bacterium]|nr:RICIN domain-containing protein [Candidatus Saccharibacteria bacterium]